MHLNFRDTCRIVHVMENDAAWVKPVDGVLARMATMPGALLPILHAVQHELGYVPPDSVPRIAAALNLSRAEVHGVVSFYHEFREAPPGRHVLKICRAESCQAVGAESLVTQVTHRLGVEFASTSTDGHVTVEPVYCLGLCALSPALTLNGNVHARVTPERMDQLLNEVVATR